MNTKTPEDRAAERFDREASYIELHRGEGYATCIREEVEPLEAENAKLRALVQKLTDLVFHDSDCGNVMHNGKCDCFASVAIAAAKEHGFVPTNTTEG